MAKKPDIASRRGMMRDLPARLGTAVLYGAVVLGVVIYGQELGWAILISVVSAVALAEFYRMTRESRRMPNEVFGVAAAAVMPFASLTGQLGLAAVVTVLVSASLLWHLAFRQVRLADTAITVFGVVYVGFTLSHLVFIRAFAAGTVLLLATLFCVWLNDIMAYFVGSSLGRHKMAPRISPNKTWEGFAAGTVASVLVWVGVYFVTTTGISLTWHIVIGAALALAAVAGDLVESRLKREMDVKDSGSILPGHGGFLDRVDALITVGIVAYYLLVWAGAR